MTVAVTDTMGHEDKFQRYLSWLARGGREVECLTLSYARNNSGDLDRCGALVLTGGHDVDPRLYHGPENHPRIVDVDRRRDDFEMQLLERALSRGLPVLAICRGLQLANVYFGGTLIPDIEEAGFPSHKGKAGSECRHPVTLEENSALAGTAGILSGEVSSSHHQAVDAVGGGLRVVARSADGIVEALERNDRRDGFFLLVQWHPERMIDMESPLADKVLQQFLSSGSSNITHTSQ